MNIPINDTILSPEIQKIRVILESVKDPEVPVLSVLDLGIIRNIAIEENPTGTLQYIITITPTYSGCPAMDVISLQIKLAMIEAGYKNVLVKQALSPAWTTDWMTESGKQKLKEFGIAPPQYKAAAEKNKLFATEKNIACPRCGSLNTRCISEFGATACKALYQCNDCLEPFDYFKCH